VWITDGGDAPLIGVAATAAPMCDVIPTSR